MKMLYLANQRMPTDKAYGFQIAKMCQAFTESGHEVELVIPTRGRVPYASIFEYYGIPGVFKVTVINSPELLWPGIFGWLGFHVKNFLSARKLVRYALSKKADLIYSRDELLLYLLAGKNTRIAYEAHKFSPSRKIFYGKLKRKNIPVIAISNGLKEKFERFGFKRIMVAHDAVDIKEFNIEPTQAECRKQLNLPAEGKLIGYVGQLRTMGMEKGIADLISAIEKIPMGAFLVIVGGSASDIDFYKKLAHRHGLAERVIFTGFQKHQRVPLYLKAFDVLAMPFPHNEHYANFMSPLKLFEYMASSRPIVATNLPTIQEILNDDNSILVPPDSSEDLAKGIQILLYDTELGKRLAGRAYRDVEQYTWGNRVSNILKFISIY